MGGSKKWPVCSALYLCWYSVRKSQELSWRNTYMDDPLHDLWLPDDYLTLAIIQNCKKWQLQFQTDEARYHLKICSVHCIKLKNKRKNFGKLATKFKSWIFENSSHCISFLKVSNWIGKLSKLSLIVSAMILVQSQKIVKRKQKNALVKLATKELSVINVQQNIGIRLAVSFNQPYICCCLFVLGLGVDMGHGASLSSLWLMIVTVIEGSPNSRAPSVLLKGILGA